MSSSPASPRPKATLFCQTCDHESGVDGDWIRRRRSDGTGYECPECGREITTRRTVDERCPTPIRSATRAAAACGEAATRGWWRLWLARAGPRRADR